VGLGSYRSNLHRSWEQSVLAVAGNAIQDFALYYALSRMTDRVVWVLPQITAAAFASFPEEVAVNVEFHFVHALKSLGYGDSSHSAGVKLVSASLGTTELTKVKDRIEAVAMMPISGFSIGEIEGALPSHPIRHYEANNAYRMRSLIASDGLIPLFETPLPRNFREVNPSKHRWITELQLNKVQIPRHPALGHWTMGSAVLTTKEVRTSIDGLAYFCPSIMILGGNDAEASVPRPTIRIPEPLQIFQVVARGARLSCAISDKGLYAQDACRKFGGLANFAAFLRSDVGQLFSRAYLDKSKPAQGEYLKGVPLAGRRYYDFNSLSSIFGDEKEAERLLDRLSLLRILYRGLILQCEYCRRADWFGLSELSDAFTCRRCHKRQIFTKRHWRYPEQPQLYYQLDELMYQALENEAIVPVLTLDRLERISAESFLYVSELSYTEADADKPLCEIDVNCVLDGVLTIGEAKKGDRLGKNDKEENALLSHYVSLAQRLGARQIVFATLANQWHDNTLEKIKKAVQPDSLRLRILCAADLLS